MKEVLPELLCSINRVLLEDSLGIKYIEVDVKESKFYKLEAKELSKIYCIDLEDGETLVSPFERKK